MKIKLIRTLTVIISFLGVHIALAEGSSDYPKDYRRIISDVIRQTYKDPGSIRDAKITAPFIATYSFEDFHFVCVQTNAKNSYGAYTGLQETAYLFQSGSLIYVHSEGYYTVYCRRGVYQPFKEIEGKS